MLKDSRQISIPLTFLPRLSKASEQNLSQYTISGSGIVLHWENLDEDLNVPALVLGILNSENISRYA